MGDMFEKATRTVKEVGESVIGSAKNLGTSIYTTSKEQGEIAGMKIQQSVINKRLDESYAKIGKRYVEYINNSNGGEVFDISDILDEMKDDMQKLEEIANSFEGVDKSFAIQAGRELRVIVKPEQIDDLGAHQVAREIKEKIEQTMQYPGTIKVVVIRETRALEEAK